MTLFAQKYRGARGQHPHPRKRGRGEEHLHCSVRPFTRTSPSGMGVKPLSLGE